MPEEKAEEGNDLVCGLDLDDTFAYDTIKEVRVLDRRLGLIYYAVLGMVVFYIIIFCLIIKQQYLAMEKTNGFMMTKVLNPAFANATDDNAGLPFDVFEAFSNPGESGALFLPTRVVVTRGQSQEGECGNPMFSCKADKDCDTGEAVAVAKCEKGSCVRRGWCPPEQLGASQTEAYEIDALKYEVWFQGMVQYHVFQDINGGGLSAGNIEEPAPILSPAENANTYGLPYILEKAQVKLKDVWQDGAIVLLTAKFDCDLDAAEDEQCLTNIEGATVDYENGFNYKVVTYRDEGGERKRNLYHFYGIRLVVFAMGLGKRADPTQIVLVLSQAIALLSCAGTVADVFLQYMVPERKHYIEQKIIQTEDFGDEK